VQPATNKQMNEEKQINLIPYQIDETSIDFL